MKKLSTLFVCMLMIVTILPSTAMAGDEENPEITDDTGDAFGYIDIVSIWFYEQQETPEFLYVSMKINEPSEFKFQQTFAVFWRYNSIRYACSLHMGFSLTQWKHFTAGKDDNKEVEHIDINGTYHVDSGIITWIIPKVYIGDPQHGDVLTNTWSNAFRRLGFIGRIGFSRIVLDAIILQLFGNNMWDYAPEKGEYGRDYVIQY